MKKILGVIPARYGSTRFPGKPLAEIHGKSMIRRVWEQAKQAEQLHEVLIATDDDRIKTHAETFGANVIMTSPDHPSGTDRIIEVATRNPEFHGFVNIQGDEPFIPPAQINTVAEMLLTAEGIYLATLVRPIDDPQLIQNPNLAKVVLDQEGKALYFSRSPIPYLRDQDNKPEGTTWLKHIGIYGYTSEALTKIKTLPRGHLEQVESLEQLRWLEHGLPVHTRFTFEETLPVDTPEDLEKVRLRYQPSDLSHTDQGEQHQS